MTGHRAVTPRGTRENVELVRRIYEEGLFDRQPERLLDLATPDIECVNPPSPPSVRSAPGQRPRFCG
jgi:hypothetical protein